MTTRRIASASLAVALLGGAGMTFSAASATAETAHAATSSAKNIRPGVRPAISFSCPAHNFCTWLNAGYQGTRWDFNQTAHGSGWFYVGSAANDKISSFVNARGWWTDISKNYPWNNPDTACIENGLEYSNLANNNWADGSSANDSISGIRLTSDISQMCPYGLS
jgi:Peptidase inhibitor family I36